MARTGRHVLPRPDGWAVVKPSADRASALEWTQHAAIDRARRIVAGSGGDEVVIHGRDRE